MKEDINSIIESFGTLIICETPLGEDIFTSPMTTILGDFPTMEMPPFSTLAEVFESLDSRGEIVQGIGFDTYQRTLRKAVTKSIAENRHASIVLPLINGSVKKTFTLTVDAKEDTLHLLFVLFNEQNSTINIHSVMADTFKDNLTGLFNFNTFNRHLSTDIQGGFISLFDINRFKTINDTYGHEVGDDVLILIADYLISIASSREVFYRRSGDEFIIFFLTKELDYAKSLIRKINDHISEIPSTSLPKYEGLECSASFGLVELPLEEELCEIGTETVLKVVDLAMYQAKKGGRLLHYISLEDMRAIIAMGNLDERLQALAKAMKR